MILYDERKKREELFKLMQENPDLPVIPFVDDDVVGDDSYGSWMGSWDYSYIDEYVLGEERVFLKSECDEDEVLDGFDEYRREWDEWSDEKITETYNNLPWVKCIVVRISTPEV